MGDIYAELAAKIADHAVKDVSSDERSRAKEAFWEAFEKIVMLPGNGHLRPGLCSRCGEAPGLRSSAEICAVCVPVGLCVACFALHAREVAADKADGLHP